jgi:hypothetical protein
MSEATCVAAISPSSIGWKGRGKNLGKEGIALVALYTTRDLLG